jgi:hypothetical protein
MLCGEAYKFVRFWSKLSGNGQGKEQPASGAL